MIWSEADIIIIEIKCIMNVMLESFWHHPPSPVHGKIAFQEISPWCKKSWGLLVHGLRIWRVPLSGTGLPAVSPVCAVSPWESPPWLPGLPTSPVTQPNISFVSHKVKNWETLHRTDLPYSSMGIKDYEDPKDVRVGTQRDICKPIIRAALFTVAKG